MSPASLAFVLSSMRLSGGVLVVAHLARRLALRGCRVVCVTSAGGAARQAQEILSPGVALLSASTSLEQAAAPWGRARLVLELARLIPACDMVIATHTPTVVPALLARRLLRRSRRAVWFHQDYAEMFERRPAERWLHRRAPRWFERVITVSQASREEIERNSGVTALVVPQGYSLGCEECAGAANQQALPGPREDTAGRPPLILYVGDRRPRKGWDDLMAALALLRESHPGLRLAIASARDLGPLEAPVPCELHVRPAWAEMQRLYRSCRVFVSASWWESFGRPPLEAMAQGAPVVTTDSRGVRDYAQHELNCLMTPIRAPAALASAIDRLLCEPALAQRLAQAGRQTALEFTWERAADAFARALGLESDR